MPLSVPSINDLDTSQRKVVEHTPYDAAIVVTGPPGSGKTSIAVLRSQVLLSNGFTNMLVILYNHSMYGFLRTIFSRMNLINNLRIETKDSYFWTLAYRLGLNLFNTYDSYEVKYRKVLDYLLERPINTSYSVIMIDESQDFSQKEIQILRKMSKNIIAVGDYDQSIYSTDLSPVVFAGINSYRLETIYRFGKIIAKIAQPFAQSYNSLEDMVVTTSNTQAYRVECRDNATEKISQILSNKLNADTTTAIISPFKEKLVKLKSALASYGHSTFYADLNKELRNYNFDSRTPLLISSFSAKGMEFDCVILYGFDGERIKSSMGDKINELLFVSITRTSNELYIIDEPSTIDKLKQLEGVVPMGDNASNRNDLTDF